MITVKSILQVLASDSEIEVRCLLISRVGFEAECAESSTFWLPRSLVTSTPFHVEPTLIKVAQLQVLTQHREQASRRHHSQLEELLVVVQSILWATIGLCVRDVVSAIQLAQCYCRHFHSKVPLDELDSSFRSEHHHVFEALVWHQVLFKFFCQSRDSYFAFSIVTSQESLKIEVRRDLAFESLLNRLHLSVEHPGYGSVGVHNWSERSLGSAVSQSEHQQ